MYDRILKYFCNNPQKNKAKKNIQEKLIRKYCILQAISGTLLQTFIKSKNI
jgi:hypothetical protein